MDRLYTLTATIPANTTAASPYNLAFPLEDNYLKYIRFIVPPGPSGLMGFRILWANQQIVPWGNLSWIVTDNEQFTIDVDSYMTYTGVVFQGYNTDIWQHTVYLRALIRNLDVATVAQANALTGAVALPAALDTSEIAGANSYTGDSTSLDSYDLTDDTSLGSEDTTDSSVNEIPVDTGTGSVTTITQPVSTTQPTGAPSPIIVARPRPVKHPLPPRRTGPRTYVGRR